MSDPRPVFFFDIDNCVSATLNYWLKQMLTQHTAVFEKLVCNIPCKVLLLNNAQDRKVHEATAVLINEFLKNTLSLDQGAAHKLHMKYLNEYSLIVEGLAQNHSISPLDFNSHVDDALPLEDLLEPDPELRKMLQDIDKSKVKLWLFTNAYINHGKRVVRLLEIEDQFEGLTYCDYGAKPMRCKPHLDMFNKAMKEACVEDVKACYFIGSYRAIPVSTARRYL
jgi:pyrimidine and pyridine-specific 5'-nucleotidase